MFGCPGGDPRPPGLWGHWLLSRGSSRPLMPWGLTHRAMQAPGEGDPHPDNPPRCEHLSHACGACRSPPGSPCFSSFLAGQPSTGPTAAPGLRELLAQHSNLKDKDAGPEPSLPLGLEVT